MSIHIDMYPYCDGCPEMDPEVENTDYYGDMRKLAESLRLYVKIAICARTFIII